MSTEPHWLRTPWVVPAMQPGCTCSWCASERRQEEHREADARKQVNLALAAYGANPYQSSLEDCHDGGPGPVYKHGGPGPFAVSRIEPEDATWAAIGKPPAPEPVIPPDREIRRELAAFDAWYVAFPQLPGWMQPGSAVPEPGRCHECFLGQAGTMTDLCIYCQLRVRVTQENDGHRELAAPAEQKPGFFNLALDVLLFTVRLTLIGAIIAMAIMLLLGR